MNVLICGAGRIALELLKRLGEQWNVTLVEKSEAVFERVSKRYSDIHRIHPGDASSPVVMDEAGLADQDYVLALTNSDEVNLAVCELAREKGVNHVLTRVHDSEKRDRFEEMGVKTLLASTMLAKIVFHYLEDPRVSVTPLGLGRGEVIEIDVVPGQWLEGRTALSLSEAGWRLSALFREGEMLFPGPPTVVKAGDRLVIVGRPDSFQQVCSILECGRPHFPLSYGRGLLLALPPLKDADPARLMAESYFFAQNTQVRAIHVICPEDDCAIKENQPKLEEGIDITFETTDDVWDEVYDSLAERSVGLVMVPPLDVSFLQSMTKPTLITLAHSLPCPLLVSRNSQPYESILVPFNASPKAELALETALDLAQQMSARVSAVVVQEPDFIHGAQEGDWVEKIFERVRELAHAHKLKVGEELRRGNPVKEVVDLAKEYDMMVVSSNTKAKGLFSPHVGELLVRRAPCSVLVVTS